MLGSSANPADLEKDLRFEGLRTKEAPAFEARASNGGSDRCAGNISYPKQLL